MARFMVKASEFKNVCKAVNDRKLAELKKEIIEILKKQDAKEFKKAVDLFESQEKHYTHLEKSITGKWVEKAGYGIGTVRIWKGKKYKKIAPGKWARVFDKEGRGTNIAIGRLISKVQKIDNIEDLMAFVMENKQRFVDENGIDLPVLDKLRAAVDAKNNGTMRSKLPDPKDDNSVAEYKKQIKDKVKEYNMNYEKYLENQIAGAERHNVTENELKALKELQAELKGTSKPAESKKELKEDYDKLLKQSGEYLNKFKNNKKVQKYLRMAKEQLGDNAQYVNDNQLIASLIYNPKDALSKFPDNNETSELEAWGDRLGDDVLEDKEFSDLAIKIYDGSHVKLEGIADKSKVLSFIKNNVNNIKTDESEEEKPSEKEETEAEKHQNRSDAMKGNQNAKKYGLTDDQIEYYDIQEVVEDVNGRGIVRNSEGKYSYIENGSVKDRPEDFEEKIEKVRDRIDASYQTQLNIEAAKAYDFKNADFGEDVQYFKMPDEKYRGERHRYFKRVPNSTKGLSVIVEISNMREPLNMTYEVYDAKTGESWEYDASYGNKEGLDWASERPEQMEKELKKFFKRDPIKEWDKMNSDVDPDAVNIEPVKSVTAKKTPIAKTTKIEDGKVSLPATKEVKDEFKQLIACLYKSKTPDEHRDFMRHVFYDGENMVATDGMQLKVINIGEMDGIEPNTYLSIDTKGKDVVIEQDKQDYGRFPAYKRVLPENNKQQIRLNNNALKEKIEEMKKDGSIDMEGKRISLKVDAGNVYLDGVRVGSAEGVKFADDRQFIDFNYKLLTNALSGDESIMAVSDNPERAVSISTNVSDNILMPLRTDHNEVDYESNRKAKAEADAALEKKRAQDAADREDRKNRSITDEAKSDILKNKPEGVTDRDYEDLIDYCNDFYAKLGYDNSTERGKRDIKRTIDNAIKGIYDKDYEILDMIEDSDNKVSRKVFETITALKLGSNRESAKKAWESWVGKEGVKAHKDKIAAAEKAEKDRVEAEKKAADDADREQYHGFLDGKSAAGKGKAKQILAKKAGFDGKVYTYQELIDHYINDLGGHVAERTYTTSGGYEKKYYGVYDKDGRGYEIPKIVHDYGKHIQEKGVKKSFAPEFFFLNEYDHDLLEEEDIEEDESFFNDYSAEQPELFNSTEYKVREALNRCRVL